MVVKTKLTKMEKTAEQKLWNKLKSKLKPLDDTNYTARILYDYITKNFNPKITGRYIDHDGKEPLVVRIPEYKGKIVIPEYLLNNNLKWQMKDFDIEKIEDKIKFKLYDRGKQVSRVMPIQSAVLFANCIIELSKNK